MAPRRYHPTLGIAVMLLALMLLAAPALQAQPYKANIQRGLPPEAPAKAALTAPDCTTVPDNAFSNCSFETGDFSSWVTQDMTTPFFALQVNVAGITPGFGLFVSAPTQGTFAALHGFDGDGATGSTSNIRICQDVVLGGGILEFDYRGGWDMTFGASQDRTFDVVVEPSGGGAPVFSTEILRAFAGSTNLDTGNLQGAVDLSSAGTGPFRVCFDWLVPEDFVGPGFFQLDNVSLPNTPADLELLKTCETGGDGTGSFHLILSNTGPGNASGVEVTDWLPAVDITGWGGDGAFDAGSGLWTLGDVMTNTTKIIWIDFTADASGYYENHAEVTAVNEGDPDSTPDDGSGDDYASCSFTIAPTIDLSLEKTCEASDDGSGSFHLALTNDGPDAATGVEVEDWIPAGLTVTGSSGDGSFDTGSGLWDVGTVDVASTAERWINFTFDPDVTAAYENHAEVSAANEGDADSAPGDGHGDDYAACGFHVYTDDRGVVPDFVPEQGASGVTDRGRRFNADLRVTKEVDVESASAGNEVEYTIGLSNAGPHSTSGVAVEDVLPECLSFVSASADRGSYDATTGLWTVGSIKVGETLELTLVAEVSDGCTETVTNTASVASTTLPDPPRLPDDPDAPLDDPFETPATILNNTASASFDVGSGRALEGTPFALLENYPNPFNPETVVPYSLGASSHVSIKVYDLLGREVAVLVEGQVSAGVHEVRFEAGALPTGMYLIRMEAAGQVAVQRVTLMK